jgi:predicted amidohydrolase
MSNAALLLSYKISRREIERIADKLNIAPAEEYEVAEAEEVRVAAVQLLLKRYTSLADYVIDMNLYVADAVNRRARLVCFPAYAGLLPASFLPQFDAAWKRLAPLVATGLPDPGAVGEFLSYYSDCMFETYFHTMSVLAARHNVAIMAGSTLYFDEDTLCHRAFLFNSFGDLVGCQDKIGLGDLELSLGLDESPELKVFDSPVGSVAILIGSDADYFETARVARGLGAKILLHPTAMQGEYTPLRTALGLNMRVQETRMWGIQSVLVGDTGLGFAAEGACCAFGPVELTKQKNGLLAKSSGRFEPDVLCQTLNLDRLSKVRNPYKQDRNIEFFEKYLDRIY